MSTIYVFVQKYYKIFTPVSYDMWDVRVVRRFLGDILLMKSFYTVRVYCHFQNRIENVHKILNAVICLKSIQCK